MRVRHIRMEVPRLPELTSRDALPADASVSEAAVVSWSGDAPGDYAGWGLAATRKRVARSAFERGSSSPCWVEKPVGVNL